MKKICILLFTAVAFVACNKVSETIINEPVEVPVNNDIPAGYHLVTLSAAQAEAVDEDTKTTYANDKVFSWTSGDEISVLFNDGSTNRFFTFSTTGTGASGDILETFPHTNLSTIVSPTTKIDLSLKPKISFNKFIYALLKLLQDHNLLL